MDQNFMKEKKVLPLVLSMSLPMMLSMLINSLYNIIDSMFVARVGEKALTAISLVYPLQTLVTSISVGFGVGISAAVAFFLGMGEHKKADQSASEGLFLSIVHGVLMSVILTAILPSFLRLFTTDEEIYQMGITYGTWVLSFSLVISVYIAYEKIYQSLGNMIVPTLCLAAGCLTNIVLDPILIFGIAPIPRMEVKGAAIATVIGQIVPLVMYIVWHRKKGLGVSIHIKDMKPDPAICGRLYAVGIPSSLTLGMPSLLITLLNKIAGAFSSVYVLVLGVYFKLQTFLYLPASGIVQGMRPILSFNYGAGEKKRMKQILSVCTGLIFGILTVGTALFLLLRTDHGMFFKDSVTIREGQLHFGSSASALWFRNQRCGFRCTGGTWGGNPILYHLLAALSGAYCAGCFHWKQDVRYYRCLGFVPGSRSVDCSCRSRNSYSKIPDVLEETVKSFTYLTS